MRIKLNKIVKVSAVLALPIVVSFSVFSHTIFAQTYVTNDNMPVTGDFLVSPTSIETIVVPGERSTTNVTLLNRTGKKTTFVFGAEDVTASDATDQGGDRVDVLDGVASDYSLKDYIKSPAASVTLDHGQQVVVPITIDVPVDELKQGLYGALTIAPAININENSAVATRLNTRIAVVIMAKTSDGVLEGELIDFRTLSGRRLFFGSPIDLSVAYENKGLVHIKQKGYVVISNIFGATSAKLDIKDWYILPKSVRSKMLSIDDTLLFGPYKATIILDGEGVAGTVNKATISFFVVSWQAGLYLLILTVILIIVFKALKGVQNRRMTQ